MNSPIETSGSEGNNKGERKRERCEVILFSMLLLFFF